MFLNFPLHKKLIPYSGIDLTPIANDLGSMVPDLIPKENYGKEDKLSAVWLRTWMGFKPSPYWAVRFYYLAEEFCRGNSQEETNPLHWDRVMLNLIGNANYNPAMPNVYKWNSRVERMAGDILSYVDDLRALGWTIEHAWSIARMIASRLQYLGIQDAARKRRLDNGAWAGSIFISTLDTIGKSVPQSKWDKGRNYILDIQAKLITNPKHAFDFKHLESVRGFLCHLGMTFDILYPYLKGFHLILTKHLTRRNREGWKLSPGSWMEYLNNSFHAGKISLEELDDIMVQHKKLYRYEDHPVEVTPIPRFVRSIKALASFFLGESPPLVKVRSSRVSLIVYGFADASGGGFGATIDDGQNIRYRIGTWGSDSDNESSNWREFTNIVETLEEEAEAKKLNDSVIIMATDNSTVEGCFYRGNSDSEKLFDLVVRVRTLELRYGFRLFITHVSGRRMVAQGTDGVSRGQLKEGIALDRAMLSYCPWGQSAVDRSPKLVSWLRQTFDNSFELLSPENWYRRGHDLSGGTYNPKNKHMWEPQFTKGNYIWSPPPAAADAALEQLRIARLKRQESCHLIVIPKLFKHLWLKQTFKVADLVLDIPIGSPAWEDKMFEGLTIAVVFPFLRHRPWQLQGCPKMFALGRQMRNMCKTDPMAAGSVLSKFWQEVTQWYNMPEKLVLNLLYFRRKRLVPCASRGERAEQATKRQKRKTGVMDQLMGTQAQEER